ncbi:thiamine phosphate synthase [Hyphomicrobium sp.]|uniref:thiamine phosphate synthase n=1 Tax=Hyphomicrobium sp. TaxID=82 RepID=UPI002E330750|nr:thiamine phosphate synthase [Hyphomicrobium sp.]HEX2842409.1 thiamine phosphate synthase [Hyphomicrobium sp.]
MSQKSSDPGLCLIVEARSGADWSSRLDAALEATGALTLILVPPGDSPAIDPTVAKPLVALAQSKTIAALLANDIATAKAVGADGVHISWRPEIEDAYEAARTALGPDAIVGVDAGISRHDAMALGEAGADYIAFGRMTDAYTQEEARETQHELVTWWAEIFLVPVVALVSATPDDVAEFVQAGVDFVAVQLPSEFPGAAVEKTWGQDLASALSASANAA